MQQRSGETGSGAGLQTDPQTDPQPGPNGAGPADAGSEDVLASIRRLVSTGTRPGAAPGPLLLTPAQRVAEGAAAEAEDRPMAGRAVAAAGPVDVASAPPPALAGEVSEIELIDEDMLQDLVARIVREELQGALGERITRNVRKLVRREIRQALAARDFD